ncbi:MAG TPA: CoA pyrophosphatase [Alphaproteobacteria bacterium]|nr:CoA pyrophosphatase [Alphaproteobacteria bacterium]
MRRRLPRFDAPAPASRRKIRGDHDLNPGLRPPAELRPAAVLVPLVEREDGLQILLTRRTDHLAAHAGQISFPGGRVEPDDEDEKAAALRETEEEIGLPPERVEVIGRLDTYITRTGFQIVPFVGLIRPPFTVRPDPHEVADVFEVPLDFILHPENPQRHSRMFQGSERFYYAFPYHERYIWGATAGILLNFREALGT